MIQQWLGRFASESVKREQPLIIGVTGAVGKSTAKQMIAALFMYEGNKKTVRASQKNYNNELGVPLTILNASAPGRSIGSWIWLLQKGWLSSLGILNTCPDILVLEMGADKPGDLAYLTNIAPPNISVVTAVMPEGTGLAPVHRENYGSIEEMVKEKATLVRVLHKTGIAILNADDQFVAGMRQETEGHVLSYGTAEEADVRIVSSQIKLEQGPHGAMPIGLEVKVQHWGRAITLEFLGVFGRPIAYATAAAIAVAEATDAPLEAVRALGNNFKPMAGRTRIIPGIKDTILFDDSYNASPVAVISAVRDLTSLTLQPHQRKIVCLGEMRELGEDSEALHKRVAEVCATHGVDILAVCGKFSGVMKQAAIVAGMHADKVFDFKDTPEAGRFLQEIIHPGDIILAKASEGTNKTKGVRMERVIKELMAEPLRASELLVRQETAWQRR